MCVRVLAGGGSIIGYVRTSKGVLAASRNVNSASSDIEIFWRGLRPQQPSSDRFMKPTPVESVYIVTTSRPFPSPKSCSKSASLHMIPSVNPAGVRVCVPS